MKTDRIKFIPYCLLIFLFSSLAYADGGLFIWTEETEISQETAVADGKLSSSGQRAVFVKSGDDGWTLYLQPGTMSVNGAAWVLPLPVKPEVSAATPDFLDQLEFATAPVFETKWEITYYCPDNSGGGGGCWPMLGGASSGDDSVKLARGNVTESEMTEDVGITPGVMVWGAGTAGDYEYEILSAQDGDQLQEWLKTNGYAVPSNLGTMAKPYVDNAYFFFAAKFSREGEDPENLSVVRFELKGVDMPEYPVMLTPVSTTDRLEFRVFIVADERYEPGNCGAELVDDFYQEITWLYESDVVGAVDDFEQAYLDKRKALTNESDFRTMAIEYMGPLTQEDIQFRLKLTEEDSDAPLGSDKEAWADELKAIVDGSLTVSRFYGAFAKSDMDLDISFKLDYGKTGELARFERAVHGDVWLSSDDSRCEEASAQNGLPGGERPSQRYAGLALLAVALFSTLVSVRQAGRRKNS